MNAMQAIRSLVELGVIEVRPSGEIWKPAIRDSHGNIRKIKPRRAEVRLKAGYLGLKVEWQGRPYLALAHRVVWTLLRGPIPKGMQINHKDGDKTNNNPANLEVVTPKQNIQHSIRTGLTPPRGFPPERRLELQKAAQQLRRRGLTYNEIATRLNVSQTTAFRAVQRQLLPG